LGTCGVDPQSMVPKGLMTKNVGDSKEQSQNAFAQLMSQLPFLQCGASNLPTPLAEMNSLVTPAEMLPGTAGGSLKSNLKGNEVFRTADKGAAANTTSTTNAYDPVKQICVHLDKLTWKNVKCFVTECSVAPIYHPHTLYRAAHKAHRSVIGKKCNLRLCCEFLVQLSNNWPSFSFEASDKEFQNFFNQTVADMKHQCGQSDTLNANLNLTLDELSLEAVGNETQSSQNGVVVEKRNISLVTLCVQISLGFAIYSSQKSKSPASWLKDMISNMSFMMELHLRQCLEFDRIHLFMLSLMDKDEEWSWTMVCEILMRYGHRLDLTQNAQIQVYFDRMNVKCQMQPQGETRIQNMLTQVMEIRKNSWQKKPMIPTERTSTNPFDHYQPNSNGSAKSYASLVKTTLSSIHKKRLLVIPSNEKKEQFRITFDKKQKALL
ncbi:hypothetical protein RFI_18363, partial [Reticulomyxa filosa]